MVDKDTLKKIGFLKDMPDPVLEKIGTIARVATFDEETIIFRQNQKLALIYMLVSGKVFLNSRSSSGHSITLDEVTPGRTFGLSALIEESSGTFSAVCAEASSIITISSEEMHSLFKSDFLAGHLIMAKVVEIFRSRMEKHTRYFIHSLTTHPEVSRFI